MTIEAAPVPSPAVEVGAFRLIRVLGQGGQSTVYLAERTSGFAQRVAIKMLHAVSLTRDHEHTLLASLDHPNIVRLLDQGVAEDGRRYLVMEYIDGPAIDAYCDAQRLTIAARVALLCRLMAGVSYAHRQLVVHADIKPSNVLVDASGEPRLLDFGVASVLGQYAVAGSAGEASFTPAYGSPEQRRHEPVTVASDIYSLGMLAALLLTGETPAVEKDGSLAPGELLRRAEPEGLRAVAAARSASPAGLHRALAGDLDAILRKALEADPARRYSSVQAFRDDLLAHLESRPITARPPTQVERARKWVRRHWVLASVIGVVSTAVALSVVGVSLQTARAERQRRRAQVRLEELVRLTGTLDGELYDSVRPLDHGQKARSALIASATQTLDRVAASESKDPVLSLELAQEYAKLARLQAGDAPGDASARARARADAEKGIQLLSAVPGGGGGGARTEDIARTDAALRAIEQSLAEAKPY